MLVYSKMNIQCTTRSHHVMFCRKRKLFLSNLRAATMNEYLSAEGPVRVRVHLETELDVQWTEALP